MTRAESSPTLPFVVTRREHLIAAGATAADLTRAVKRGELLRSRRGRYLPGDTHPHVVEAVRCGGRLDCVSLLARLGVFVLTSEGAHVQLDRDASRVPPPARDTTRHWRATEATTDAAVVPLVEALAQSVRCQGARAAVATLDSAWHLGYVGEAEVRAVFRLLPLRYAMLFELLDPRSEAGTESLVRLILRSLRCRVELQAPIDGVGRVDLLVDGWLIVECDSAQFHSGWQSHVNDRRRDLEAAARGFVTVRLLAQDVFARPDWVRHRLSEIVRRGGRAITPEVGDSHPVS